MGKDQMIGKERTDDLMDGMVIARYESHGQSFEIIVEADHVGDLQTGTNENVLEHMPSEAIFTDSKKGKRASTESMLDIFDTDDVASVALDILKNGQVQLTTEQRRTMLEEKRKQVITAIARDAMNPQTKTPHPPQRIENAMDEAGVHIDPLKPVHLQVKEVVEALRPLLPISFEKVRIAVKVQASDQGKCYGDIKALTKVQKEEWQSDGSWIAVLEVSAGMQEELLSKLGQKTKGNVETKIIK
jgi:ribosome maturation protein SDO1